MNSIKQLFAVVTMFVLVALCSQSEHAFTDSCTSGRSRSGATQPTMPALSNESGAQRSSTASRTQQITAADQVPEGLTKSDWASIRAAHEAWRHAFQPVPDEGGVWQAHNPGQQWITRFDGRGFLATPRDGGWTWGLELKGYGFPGAVRDISGVSRVTAGGQRLAYQWDAALEEWFLNDQRGLEHGYTVKERPPQAATLHAHPSTFNFTLAVRGSLTPQVSADGKGLEFRDATGATVLNYSGLKVWDADGKFLTSRFAALDPQPSTSNSQLSTPCVTLSVEEQDARYPLTIDPIAQQAYLKASNTGGGDNFGYSVAVSGDTVVVGARSEASSTTGVNSTPNELAFGAGAAYVFVRQGTNWSQQAYLKASNTGADWFGHSVAVGGDTVVVGAPLEASSAAGVNSTPNEGALEAGAAYVYVRSGTNWSQQAYLKASNPGASDNFGYSVGVSGDTVVVGAPSEDSSATGVNSPPNELASGAGATYVFVRTGTNWSQQAYLKASNPGASDFFGYSMAVSGETVVVGAFQEDSSTTGVNSTPNELASGAGAAYVFVRSGTNWNQQAYLKASNPGVNDNFGYSVGMDGDSVVVGAWFEDSSTTWVNSTPDEFAMNSGAAYVYVRSGTNWSQQAYLKARNAGLNDNFGYSVAVSGGLVVVGAPLEDSSTTGVNNLPNELAPTAGAAYVFVRSGTNWNQQAYLKASNTGANDYFGISVAASGNTVVVGARSESSSTTGVNSPPNELASGAGAAYIFTGLGPIHQIVVSGNALPIANGDTAPDLADHTDFGPAIVGGTPVIRAFTITNAGFDELNLPGMPKVVVSGAHAAEFIVTAKPASPVAAVGSTTFQITFTPGGSGLRTATLAITNNDANASPYSFQVQGTGVNPIGLTNPTKLSHGAVQFDFTNGGGLPFTVWASTNVTWPSNAWSNLGPAVEVPPGSGQYKFSDPEATNHIMRFYRVRLP